MNGENSLYYYIAFFMIYSLLGWSVEVIYATIKSREFSNRGFLNGPLCPIYGFGVVIIITFLGEYKEHVLQLFIYSTVLVSALEYIVGFALEKLFHHKWWDYSDMKFNIGGYISLYFSLRWGVACVIILKYVHPIIEVLVLKVPLTIGHVIVASLVVLILIDTYVTVFSVIGLNRRLSRLEDVTVKIKELSDGLGESLYETTSNILDKNDEIKMKTQKRRKILQHLKSEESNLIGERKITHRRLLKAFPTMKSYKFGKALETLKRNKDK